MRLNEILIELVRQRQPRHEMTKDKIIEVEEVLKVKIGGKK